MEKKQNRVLVTHRAHYPKQMVRFHFLLKNEPS
jgi:hypothetical protein